MNDASALIELIAPCGMDCRLCKAFQRERKPCPGCRNGSIAKPKTRAYCGIKNCIHLAKSSGRYCFVCKAFPCEELSRLDKRYRAKYTMSMVDNLREISISGDAAFLLHQDERWTCKKCGRLVSVHNPSCLSCGRLWKDVPAGERGGGGALSGEGTGK